MPSTVLAGYLCTQQHIWAKSKLVCARERYCSAAQAGEREPLIEGLLRDSCATLVPGLERRHMGAFCEAIGLIIAASGQRREQYLVRCRRCA